VKRRNTGPNRKKRVFKNGKGTVVFASKRRGKKNPPEKGNGPPPGGPEAEGLQEGGQNTFKPVHSQSRKKKGGGMSVKKKEQTGPTRGATL